MFDAKLRVEWSDSKSRYNDGGKTVLLPLSACSDLVAIMACEIPQDIAIDITVVDCSTVSFTSVAFLTGEYKVKLSLVTGHTE